MRCFSPGKSRPLPALPCWSLPLCLRRCAWRIMPRCWPPRSVIPTVR
ncbi:hypothetical protein [Pararhizobium sp. YC-54]